MKSNYYTPNIEEFHVGFEYEVEDLGDDGVSRVWRKQVFDGEETRTYFIEELGKDEMRVKHLDREDIESLGFYCHPTDNRVFHNKDGIIINTGWSSPVRKDEPTLVITHQVFDESKTRVIHEHYLFNGTIKNKSELKRLLKQIGI